MKQTFEVISKVPIKQNSKNISVINFKGCLPQISRDHGVLRIGLPSSLDHILDLESIQPGSY